MTDAQRSHFILWHIIHSIIRACGDSNYRSKNNDVRFEDYIQGKSIDLIVFISENCYIKFVNKFNGECLGLRISNGKSKEIFKILVDAAFSDVEPLNLENGKTYKYLIEHDSEFNKIFLANYDKFVFTADSGPLFD
jgi:hypothetical protein